MMNGTGEHLQWPWLTLLVANALGFLLFSAFVPALDGNNGPRLLFFVGVSFLLWVRYAVARVRCEQDRAYVFYVVLILITPFVWIGLEALLT